MSIGLMPYLVSSNEVEARFVLDLDDLRDLMSDYEDRITEIDSTFEGIYEKPFTVSQALTEIVKGKVRTSSSYFNVYASALELLCAYCGHRLPNGVFSPCKWEWFEQVDELLEQCGADLRLTQLASCGPPLPLPPNKLGGMDVGHWTPEQVTKARPVLLKAGLRAKDPIKKEALETIRGWFQHPAKSADSMMVGFCY